MKNRYRRSDSLKKFFTGIMFIVSCVLDTYTLTLLIHDIQFNEIIILLTVIGNITLVSLSLGLIVEMQKLKKIGNICIDDIDLTVIGQKNITRKKINTLRANTVQYTYDFLKMASMLILDLKEKLLRK